MKSDGTILCSIDLYCTAALQVQVDRATGNMS